MDSKRVARIFNISQDRSQDHDPQPNPEQYEEPSEIPVLAFRIEVRDSSRVVHCRKQAVLLILCSNLLPGR